MTRKTKLELFLPFFSTGLGTFHLHRFRLSKGPDKNPTEYLSTVLDTSSPLV